MRVLLFKAFALMVGLLLSGLSTSAHSLNDTGVSDNEVVDHLAGTCLDDDAACYSCPSPDCNNFVYTVEIAEATEHEVHREKLRLKKKVKASTWGAGLFCEYTQKCTTHRVLFSGKSPDPRTFSDRLYLVLRVLRI